MTLKPRNINAGHRERMREKFVRNGINGFLPHEALEMLLFYPIAYKDTNPLAHLMIEHFGSFTNVMNSTVGELCEVNGVGEQTAIFIKAIQELGSRVFVKNKEDVVCLYDQDVMGKYAVACLGDEVDSCLYMLVLNSRLELLATVRIAEDLFPNELLPEKYILEQALLYNASIIALISHRIDKPMRPSRTELEDTVRLMDKLEEFNIKLIEQYSVAGAQYFCYSRVLPALMCSKPNLELFYNKEDGEGGN